MPSLKTVLVVDDNAINRRILSKVLSDEHGVMEAENGAEALTLLEEHCDEIVAVMLDLVMPVMDGYAMLAAVRGDPRYSNLPIIVTTESVGNDSEIRALALGAWDFVSKPYNPEIIRFRLKNAIARSQLTALKRLKYLAEYDALTGIYNKAKFFEATRRMMDENPEEQFAFLRFDVDRFQLINSFFGTAEGDKLLIYIAKHLAEDAAVFDNATYGRIESDVVGICLPYEREKIENLVLHAKKTLEKYNPNYDIVPSIGIYVVTDRSISVEEMYNRATLASKTCKGNYVEFYAYYSENMSTDLNHEQEIVNEMNFALESGQFEIYFQPQYNIHTNLPCGAEALVRWVHPRKGVLSPAEFIPVFERNGFITKMDYYVWEKACKCLRAWTDQGMEPYPISVNVSRVNVYNPRLAENLLELVQRYGIAPELLNLELTESAYTDNPVAMKKTMEQLQSYGFVIMMDDFGSGYSSLSLLKDIAVDVLKIDMRFLAKTEVAGRGENIIASVIRMAKWLNIPVIAEGAETADQVDFLRSVGCDYVQGYYFARPMPVAEYEQLFHSQAFDVKQIADQRYDRYRYDDLFSLNPEMKLLFGNALQAAAIYEFVDDQVEMIRVNEAYYALLGHDDMLSKAPDMLELVDEDYRAQIRNAFHVCARTQSDTECEYLRHRSVGTAIWLSTKLHYVSTMGDKHIIIGELTDITLRHEIDSELQKYRSALLTTNHSIRTILLLDKEGESRESLKQILQNTFRFLGADTPEAAIQILQQRRAEIDLILLDITLPEQGVKAFLKYKRQAPELDGIPVIMITDNGSTEQQISTFAQGANDYIVRPLVPEMVRRRVKNVLESNHRFKEMVKEYNDMSEQVRTDLMTGLINRVSAEEMITQRLASTTGTCVMLMLDIDNFKTLNDSRGHAFGDKVIALVAERLRASFRQDDIVARMGGDEFAVFVSDIPDVALVEDKARALCRAVTAINIDGQNAMISCSVGIAVTSEAEHSFEQIYKNADKALYNAKFRGRNTVLVYGREVADVFQGKWLNETEGIMDSLNDSLYICDRGNYELIYANEQVCKSVGITPEDCRGKKCYEALKRRTEPCTCCPMTKTIGNQMYIRLLHSARTQRTYLLRGKNINRNGTAAHLEVVVDVTDVEGVEIIPEEAE
ncbi:MAG: EAL domain-containing protein [Pseudoflavonifractor sp.]